VAEKLIIFISGTMRDLRKERKRVAAAIRAMGLEPVWAEGRGATNRPSRDECERMAQTCDVYLGLYGLSYGWKFPPDANISVTEFEWQTAKAAGKPMLIYHQCGEADPEQAAFLSRVGDWQQGRFLYSFETFDDLLPRLCDDLARLIKESFRPMSPDEDIEMQVIKCLESMGYEIKTNLQFEGVQIPILAEYKSGLLVPQQLVIGCRPQHIDSLITAISRVPHVVYIAHGNVPERISQQREGLHLLPLEKLFALAGPGRAEAQLRQASWDWRLSGVMRWLSWEQFEWISAYRRQLRKRLDPVELAYALRCSLQHGKNIPFWCKANSDNAKAVEVILHPIIKNYGRRPLLRAGYALGKTEHPFKKHSYISGKYDSPW